jgi:hypothetical protein
MFSFRVDDHVVCSTPLAVQFSSVQVLLLETSVSAAEVFRKLICSVVALAWMNGKTSSSKLQVGFVDDESLVFPHTIGFGIVVAIDQSRKCFHIVTPLSSIQLSSVNTLICGSIAMPPIFVHNSSDYFQEFSMTSNAHSGFVSSGMKSRGNILRRRLNN